MSYIRQAEGRTICLIHNLEYELKEKLKKAHLIEWFKKNGIVL